MQATREQKARLETAVISAGRQLKLVTSQRNNLTQMMSKKVADETAKNLESVYAPLLDAYKDKCARLEEQIRAAQPAQPAQPGPAQSEHALSPYAVPQLHNQALQVRILTCLSLAEGNGLYLASCIPLQPRQNRAVYFYKQYVHVPGSGLQVAAFTHRTYQYQAPLWMSRSYACRDFLLLPTS